MFFTQQSHAIGGQANAITCGTFAMHCDMTIDSSVAAGQHAGIGRHSF